MLAEAMMNPALYPCLITVLRTLEASARGRSATG
jgi:hypothetical protein